MNRYELFPDIYTNEGQTEALDLIFSFLRSNEKVFLLNGAGGTGKTSIIKKVLEDYPGKYGGITISHKAKKVLGNSIGSTNVMTIASALSIKLNEQTGEFSPDLYKRGKGEIPINNLHLIIVDECSMLSDALIKEIKEFKKPNAKVIFVGDISQLPPIGQFHVSSIFKLPNQYTLTEKMRQAVSSPIINIGTMIAENLKSPSPILTILKLEDRIDQYDEESGSSVIFENDENLALDEFVKDFQESNGNVNHVKAITFNNEKHSNSQSVKNLNIKIRKKLWKEQSSEQFVIGEMLTSYDSLGIGKNIVFNNSEDFIIKDFRKVGDVLITAECYDNKLRDAVSLNDLEEEGVYYNLVFLDLINEYGESIKNIPVIDISSKEKYENHLKKLWKYSIPLAYQLQNQFANLQYAYAITSHKSQGSTYNCAYVFEDNILGVTNGGTIVAKNQALYVAVSRPRKKLVMIGSENKKESLKTKEKDKKFTILPTDIVKAAILDFNSNEILTTIHDKGFKSANELMKMLIYKSNVKSGKYNFEIHLNSENIETKQSKYITKTI